MDTQTYFFTLEGDAGLATFRGVLTLTNLQQLVDLAFQKLAWGAVELVCNHENRRAILHLTNPTRETCGRSSSNSPFEQVNIVAAKHYGPYVVGVRPVQKDNI